MKGILYQDKILGWIVKDGEKYYHLHESSFSKI